MKKVFLSIMGCALLVSCGGQNSSEGNKENDTSATVSEEIESSDDYEFRQEELISADDSLTALDAPYGMEYPTAAGEELATPNASEMIPTHGHESGYLVPKSLGIDGDLAGCFEVVDSKYQINTKTSPNHTVTIKLKRTDKELPFDIKDADFIFSQYQNSNKKYFYTFNVEVLNASGDIIASWKGGAGVERNEVNSILKLKPGKTASLSFGFPTDKGEAAYFIISSVVETNN